MSSPGLPTPNLIFREPWRVAREHRVVAVRALAGGDECGRCAWLHMQRATRAFKPWFEICVEFQADVGDTVPVRDIDVLIAARRWSATERRAVDRWFEVNRSSIDAAYRAFAYRKMWIPLVSPTGRLCHVRLAREGGLVRIAELFHLNAARCRLDGDAHGAWGRVFCLIRLAQQAFEQPFDISQMFGLRLLRDACQACIRAMAAVEEAPPEWLVGEFRFDRLRRVRPEVIAACEALFTFDMTESITDWARSPRDHKQVEEDVRGQLSVLSDLGVARDEELPDPLATLREIAQRTDARACWARRRQAQSLIARALRRKFAVAWKERSSLQRDVDQLQSDSPVHALYGPLMAHLGCDGALQFSYVENLTRCFCNATLTLAAILDYRRQHGKLPARLSGVPALADNDDTLDPFSGRSLVYRRNRGGGFVLYSVGADQVDSGGRHNEFGREAGDWVFWPP